MLRSLVHHVCIIVLVDRHLLHVMILIGRVKQGAAANRELNFMLRFIVDFPLLLHHLQQVTERLRLHIEGTDALYDAIHCRVLPIGLPLLRHGEIIYFCILHLFVVVWLLYLPLARYYLTRTEIHFYIVFLHLWFRLLLGHRIAFNRFLSGCL